MWLLWIDQNRPMEKNYLSALFEENSVGNYEKTRMNKHKINNHNNTYYKQKEQQSPKERNITDEMEHSQTYRLRVRDDDWRKRRAGVRVLLWIDQNRPMEKNFLSALFEENSVGNYKKNRMNKHKINNHNNTFSNKKEQQSANKRNITDEMEHSQTYILRVRDDDWRKRRAGVCVLLWTDQNRPMEKKLFVSTLWKEQSGESKNHYDANTMACHIFNRWNLPQYCQWKCRL